MSTVTSGNVIPAANMEYFWNSLVLPRLGNANHLPDAYVWGGSFDSVNINQGTDCTGASSAEVSALMRGPGCIYQRQFWTGTFAGVNPGDHGPFGGIDDTKWWVCVGSPDDVPTDAAMTIAVIQDPTADQAHMIVRVQGVDIEMGGQSNNYHDSLSDRTCAHVTNTGEFNQWFYVDATIEPGAMTPDMPTEPSDTIFADVSEFQVPVTDAYTAATFTAGNGVTANYNVLSIRSNDGTYQDHNFKSNYQWCVDQVNNGKLLFFIVYFYWRPGSTGSQTHMSMVNAAGGPHPKMVTMIDLESGGNPGGDETGVLTTEYNNLASWLGNEDRVIAYANLGDEKSMWQAKPQHLDWILAGYGSNPQDPSLTKLAHQYTDGTGYGASSGLPDGAPPFGNCDMNSADGLTPSAFAAAVGVGGTTPVAPVTPVTPVAPGGDVNYLSAQQQQNLYNWTMWTYAQLQGFDPAMVAVQLPGCEPTPTGKGWPQLGKNTDGSGLTPVDAIAAIKNTVTAKPADTIAKASKGSKK